MKSTVNKMKLIYIKIFAAFLLSAMFISCTPQFPDCISEKEKNLKIRWGNYIAAEKKVTGFDINSLGVITSIPGNKEVLQMEREYFCEFKSKVQALLLKTQALNVPADTNRFIEFINPDLNVRMRAVWNPNHKNVGNEEFQKLFDSLLVLIPEIYVENIR